jgi:hypothetical protein
MPAKGVNCPGSQTLDAIGSRFLNPGVITDYLPLVRPQPKQDEQDYRMDSVQPTAAMHFIQRNPASSSILSIRCILSKKSEFDACAHFLPTILNHLSSLIFTDWNQRPSVSISGSKPVRLRVFRVLTSLRLRRSRARKSVVKLTGDFLTRSLAAWAGWAMTPNRLTSAIRPTPRPPPS